ncbi:MAG: signal recognition particle protein [Firmicutes bacterium]|jgi:signal recognition particle subunit SRP54|nr:signal recognition particle protein [Bacillota bacterium]
MLESLAEKIQSALKKLGSKGRLTEADVKAALREVRLALLEADVNFKVVKEFIGRVQEKAVGQEVLTSLTPAQQVIKVVQGELTALLGGEATRLQRAATSPTVYMMVGLQGAGKTTTAAKLARKLAKEGYRPLLVAADVYRPAAIKQLQVLGENLKIPVFSMGEQDPVSIVSAAVEKARREAYDPVLIDTAGRLHIDEDMMAELVKIKEAVSPTETLLVVDAMTGQDAVTAAAAFQEKLGLTGCILTKLDGDARGGAALSVRAVTGVPIKFIGVGENTDALEIFHPERLATRILGMGDVLTLIEKAEQTMDAEKSRQLEQKLRRAQFTLDDFRTQLQEVRKMGPVDQLLGHLPGFGQLKKMPGFKVDEKELVRVEAMISSMTVEERAFPEIIDASRKRRIARGSGTTVQDVNRLLKQFTDMRKLLKQFGRLEKKGKAMLPMGPFLQ